MKSSMIPVVVALALPAPLLGQALTAEQAEVWQAVEECWRADFERRDAGALVDCFHEDYTFWWAGDVLPFDKALVRRVVPRFVGGHNTVAYDIRPARIVVRGDLAIVHWGVRGFEMTEDGTRSEWTERISMTMVKENGRWLYFGGGGSPFKP